MTNKKILYFAVLTSLCALFLAFKVVPYLSDLRAHKYEQASMPKSGPFDDIWLQTNSDYVGWIKIAGTNIDYPVVRASNNTKYLNRSFHGEDNRFGAIFMDFRCKWESPHIIIYGHSLGDDNKQTIMFGALNNLLDEKFLEANKTINIFHDGYRSDFEIFAVKSSDIHDPAYTLNFDTPNSFENFLTEINAPETQIIAQPPMPDGALQLEIPANEPPPRKQILTLSTCIGADTDYRLIVHGILKRTVKV